MSGSIAHADAFERVDEKPHEEMPACPGKQPCLVTYDFAVLVMAKAWDHYYVIDSDHVAQARLVLEQERVTKAQISCSAMRRTFELAGYARDEVTKTGLIEIAVPKRTGLVLAKRPVAELEKGTREKLFTAEELVKMTGESFERPTLRQIGSWSSSNKVMTDRSVMVVYSPESANVYVLDETITMSDDAFRKTEAARRKSRTDSLVATLRSIGAQRVWVEAHSACQYKDLLPAKGWFEYKR